MTRRCDRHRPRWHEGVEDQRRARRRSTPATARSTSSWKRRRGAAASRGDRAARPHSTTGSTEQRSCGWASGSPSTASTRPGRSGPRATCSCGAHRGAGQAPDEACCRPGETELDAARRLARSPSTESTLAIQGPPGSGKTYTGARMILALVAAGKRVGHHREQPQGDRQLARRVASAAERLGVGVRIGQKPEDGRARPRAGGRARRTTPTSRRPRGGRARRRGRHARGCGPREDFAGIARRPLRRRGGPDRAGQRARHRRRGAQPIVLLGDPQQLDQPLQGTHPPGADRSALAHLLDGAATMPGRPRPVPGAHLAAASRTSARSPRRRSTRACSSRGRTRATVRGGPGPIGAAAACATWRVHAGRQRLAGGGAPVAALVEGPGRERVVVDRSARRGAPIGYGDILVVAPYNAQVGAARQRCCRRRRASARSTSSRARKRRSASTRWPAPHPQDAPRGMEFLYSLNRLNVATSRARCLARGRRAELLRVRAGRRSRCGSPTRSASSWSSRRPPLSGRRPRATR